MKSGCRALLFTLVLAACSGGQQVVTDDGVVIAGEDANPTTTTIPPRSILGKVVDGEGNPVPEAWVTIGEDAALTAPDGWFDLSTNATGPLLVSKPAWESAEVMVAEETGFLTVTLEPLKIRGLRVNATAAGGDAAFQELLDLADSTAINALVFDTKQEGGRVLYDTDVAEAHEIGAVVRAYDPVERIAQAKEHGLYTITRVVSFEDWFRAEAYPEQAFGGQWIDPTNQDAWEYPLALATEACGLGFDEIQFDYVRFPSGETVESSGQLDMTQDERVGAIEGFLREARLRIHPMGCAVSADVFGVVVATSNDQGIGQRPEEITRQVDAFSPMVYPSHYDDGWLGLAEPNDHPYDVTADAIRDAARRIQPGTILRPWLQAFWWTDAQIRRSIQAAEDAGVGWILWNANSNFSRAAIPTAAEVND